MAPRLLILRPLGLGDFLTGVPAYRALARAFPDHHRSLAAPGALHELAMRCGAFHECVDAEALVPLDRAVHGCDVAVDLHGRGPASQRLLLQAHPRRLISFACPEVVETSRGAAWRANEHEIDRWCRMLEHAGIDCERNDFLLDRRTFAAGLRGVTLVHPGAQSNARRWPTERFAAIVREERERGRRVLVTGSARERAIALAVANGAGLDRDDVVAGRTSLVELASLVADAGRVICGDTGIAHLATAFGTPSVTLFGPTSPATWGPPARRRHQVLWRGTTGDPHGAHLDPGLAAITIDDVRAALRRLDERGSGRHNTTPSQRVDGSPSVGTDGIAMRLP